MQNKMKVKVSVFHLEFVDNVLTVWKWVCGVAALRNLSNSICRSFRFGEYSKSKQNFPNSLHYTRQHDEYDLLCFCVDARSPGDTMPAMRSVWRLCKLCWTGNLFVRLSRTTGNVAHKPNTVDVVVLVAIGIEITRGSGSVAVVFHFAK